MKIRVYYEDTDMGGIVYHANYIKYCERARSELFFNSGFALGEKDCHFVVKDLTASYLSPAKLGDLLEVKLSVLECKNASTIVRHEIFNKSKKIFQADITLVFVCKGKIARLEESVKEFLLSLN